MRQGGDGRQCRTRHGISSSMKSKPALHLPILGLFSQCFDQLHRSGRA
ncbi:hypothetical protein EBBID32_29880 [Sphingobium indicum BiD32]|uniref:Uncharacterized protein n=1 Tax=Sphingobium indicum BiD32 TaxID=1301087 RepID=N1MPI4_9SPHN|nr:hypothetical protein EBBID32_29880 [Sphingobium indicum BiD32]